MSKYLFTLKGYKALVKSIFTPNEILDSVEAIDLDTLSEQGIKTLFLDVDNTILSYSERKISLQKQAWVNSLKSMGFQVYLVSNNSSRRRIQRVATQLELSGVFFALKPFPFTARELAEKHYIDFETTAVIGDQVFTDVLFGNWLRAHTILVKSLDPKSSVIKALQYAIEYWLLKILGIYEIPKTFPDV